MNCYISIESDIHIPFEEITESGGVPSDGIPGITSYESPDIVDGRDGNAFYFFDDAQYLDLGVHGDRCLGNVNRCQDGLTIAFHIYPLNYFADSMDILYSGNNGTGIKIYIHDKAVHMTVITSAFQLHVKGDYSENKWYHYTFVWDRTVNESLSVYKDGFLKDVSYNTTSIDNSYEIRNLLFIGNVNSTNTNYFIGYMDDILIWETATTPTYISYLHQSYSNCKFLL